LHKQSVHRHNLYTNTHVQPTRLCAFGFAYVTNSYVGVVLGVYFFTFRVRCYFPFPLFPTSACVGRCCVYTRLMSPDFEHTKEKHNGKALNSTSQSSTHMQRDNSRKLLSFIYMCSPLLSRVLVRVYVADYQSNSQSGCEKITYLWWSKMKRSKVSKLWSRNFHFANCAILSFSLLLMRFCNYPWTFFSSFVFAQRFSPRDQFLVFFLLNSKTNEKGEIFYTKEFDKTIFRTNEHISCRRSFGVIGLCFTSLKYPESLKFVVYSALFERFYVEISI
jgi:hypothetical protein